MQGADADFHFLIVEKASRPVLSTQPTPEFFTLLWHQAQQVTYVKRQHLKLPSSVEQEKIQEAQSVPGWGHFKLSYEVSQWQHSQLPVAATTQLSQHVCLLLHKHDLQTQLPSSSSNENITSSPRARSSWCMVGGEIFI